MPFFYTTVCAKNLYELCEKQETILRIFFKIPEDSLLRHKHFLYHDLSQVNTANEYGVLGKLKKITYLKTSNIYILHFENKDVEIVDIYADIFIYENVKR